MLVLEELLSKPAVTIREDFIDDMINYPLEAGAGMHIDALMRALVTTGVASTAKYSRFCIDVMMPNQRKKFTELASAYIKYARECVQFARNNPVETAGVTALRAIYAASLCSSCATASTCIGICTPHRKNLETYWLEWLRSKFAPTAGLLVNGIYLNTTAGMNPRFSRILIPSTLWALPKRIANEEVTFIATEEEYKMEDSW